MSNELSPGVALRIGFNSVIDVTGSGRPLNPGDELSRYNVKDDDQILLIKNNVRHNQSFGLPAFGHRIDPDALKDLANDWTLRDLGDVIFENAEPVAAVAAAASARGAFRSSESAATPAAPPAGEGGLSEVVRANPLAALAVSAAVGFALGLLVAGARR